MSKTDVIEIEGVVVEKLPNCAGTYQRKTAYEFY